MDAQIERLLADHRPGHSEFQIERFIVTRGNWTPYGRYKQVLREIDKRRRAIEDLEARQLSLLIDLDETQTTARAAWLRLAGAVSARGRLRRRRARLAIAEQRRLLARLNRDVHETRLELAHFERLADQLRPLIGVLTDERRRQLDEDLWNVRVRAMAACDLMTRGHLSESTLEILIALPVPMRTAILQEVRATLFALRQGLDGPLLNWLERDDVPGFRLSEGFACPATDIPLVAPTT